MDREQSSFAELLRGATPTFSVELRPPRAELTAREGMDAWIDMYHAIRGLTRQPFRVLLTDSAVGAQEENNLRHLVTNLGHDVSRDHIVPFLTAKHSLEFCLTYAEHAAQQGFPALVVLGGDKTLGRARCVEHAWQLRQQIRRREPRLALGGWANPYADPSAQAAHLADESFSAEFFLTQVVSHLNVEPVLRFLGECARRNVVFPGVFGVFYYRSANPRTLAQLGRFLPVPAEGLAAEFAAGATAIDICARTLRTMMGAGIRHFYISNLPAPTAASTLNAVLERVGANV